MGQKQNEKEDIVKGTFIFFLCPLDGSGSVSLDLSPFLFLEFFS